MALSEEARKRLLEESAVLEKLPTGQLDAALSSGGYGWLSGMGHLGGALGLPTTEWAEKMGSEADFYRQQAPGVTTFSDYLNTPDSSLLDYLTFLGGSSAPYMAEFAVGAGAGALAGKAARAAALHGATSQTGKLAAQKAAAEQAARQALIGGTVASYPSAVGDVASNQYDEAGQYAPALAAALGVPYAALNAIGGEAAILKAITGTAGLRNRGAKELAKYIGGQTLATAGKEGVAETGQEVLNQFGRMGVNPEASLVSGDAPERYFESFMGGATLGGFMGGAAAPFARTEQSVAEELAAAKQADEIQRQIEQTRLIQQNNALATRTSPAEQGALARMLQLQDEETTELPGEAPEGALARMKEVGLASIAHPSRPLQFSDDDITPFVTAATTMARKQKGRGRASVVAALEEFAVTDPDQQPAKLEYWLGDNAQTNAQYKAAQIILELSGKDPLASRAVGRVRPAQEVSDVPLQAGIREANQREAARVAQEEAAFGGLPLPGLLNFAAREMPPGVPPGLLAAQTQRDEANMQQAANVDTTQQEIAQIISEAVRRDPTVAPVEVVWEVEERLGVPLSPANKQRVANGVNALQKLAGVQDEVPSLPNEMDLDYLGIPERGVKAEQRRQNTVADKKQRRGVARTLSDIDAQQPTGVNFGGRPDFTFGEQQLQEQEEEVVAPVTLTAAEKRKQGNLFTQKGEPTKAATTKEKKDETRKIVPEQGQETRRSETQSVPEGPAVRQEEAEVTKAAEQQKPVEEFFDAEEIARLTPTPWKSREKLVSLPIADFLVLAEEGKDDAKGERVQSMLAKGEKFSLPVLYYEVEKAVAAVVGHEGRHRARALQQLGYTHMPVVLKGPIRWSEQSDPKKFDYVKTWPQVLVGEGGAQRPFPVTREETTNALPIGQAAPVPAREAPGDRAAVGGRGEAQQGAQAAQAEARPAAEEGTVAPAKKARAKKAAPKAEASQVRPEMLDRRIANLQTLIDDIETFGVADDATGQVRRGNVGPLKRQLEKLLQQRELQGLTQKATVEETAPVEDAAPNQVVTERRETAFKVMGETTYLDQYDNTQENEPIDVHIDRYLNDFPEPTASGLLGVIIANTQDQNLKAIAERLRELVADTGILAIDADALSRIKNGKIEVQYGSFNSGENIASIARQGRTVHTVMHELVHAATVNQLNEAAALRNKPFAELTSDELRMLDALNELEKLFEQAKGTFADAAKQRGFKDIFEFVAEVRSNPEFRRRLDMIPADATSPLSDTLYHRFLRWVARLLGAKPSMLVAAMQATEPFLAKSRAIGAGNPDATTYGNVVDVLDDFKNRAIGAIGMGFPGLKIYGDEIAGRRTSRIGVSTAVDKTGATKSTPEMRKQDVAEALRKIKQGLRDLVYHITTTQFRASVSYGFAHVHALVNRGSELTRWVRSVLNDMLRPVFAGSDEAEQMQLSSMLGLTTLIRMKEYSDKENDLLNEWWKRDIGVRDEVDHDLFHPVEELAKMGKFTAEEFAAGILNPWTGKTIKFEGVTADSPIYRRYEAAFNALQHAQIMQYRSKQEALGRQWDSTTNKHLEEVFTDQELQMPVRNFLTKVARNIHDISLAAVQSTEEGKAILENGKPKQLNGRYILSPQGARVTDGKLTGDKHVNALLEELTKQMHGLFSGNATEAQLDEIHRTLNPVTESGANFAPYDISRDELAATFKFMQAAKLSASNVNSLQQIYPEMAVLSLAEMEAKMYAIKSIAGGYMPVNRDGRFIITGQFVIAEGEEKGRVLKKGEVDPELWSLLPVTASNHVLNYLEPYAQEMDAEFAKMAPIEITLNDEAETKVKVRMQMKSWEEGEGEQKTKRYAAEVAGGVESTRINYLDQLQMLQQMGVGVSVKDRETIIKKMTSADSRVRHNLQRRGHPGYDPDYTTAISQHLNGVAALIGKRSVEGEIRSALQNDKLWGDGREEIAEAQAAYDAIKDKNSVAARIAQQNLAQVKRSFEGQTPERMQTSKQQAAELSDFYLDKLGFDLEEDSFRALRSATAVLGLGGDVAKAFTNLSSIPLHAFNALSAYNDSTGFGGGFGAKKASSSLIRAFKTISPYIKDGLARMMSEDTASAEDMFRRNAELAQANGDEASGKVGMYKGYSEMAWRFMLYETQRGGLKPQAFNAMMGNSKQSAYGTKWDRFSSRWMAMFSTAEEMNRMTTALASYELFYDKKMQALRETDPTLFDSPGGLLQARQEADGYARQQADYIVRFSQGDYSAANRPVMFRGGVGSLIFMYKTFAVTTIELLRNLPMQGRLVFLGMLWSVAGVAGIPGWEELMAVIDGMAQRLGLGRELTKGNAEREFKRFLKNIGNEYGLPLDQLVMGGITDTVTGVNIGGRMGVQLGVPLIGLLRAGTEWEKELGKALGAPVGMIGGTVRATGAAFRGDFHRMMKDQPIAGVRNWYDAYTYASTGVVLNKRGQRVVDADVVDVVARAIGYYPQDFKRANDIVKLEEYSRAFAKEITNSYMEEYRAAAVANDYATMREIRADIAEHNRDFRGTALEIKDFGKKADRAAKEAKLSLTERQKKSLSKAQQQDYFAENLQ